MRIRAVTPIITEGFGPLILEEFARVARPDTEISNVFLDSGPASVESYYDEAVAVPDIVVQVCQAEREGIDKDIPPSPREGDCGICPVMIYTISKTAKGERDGQRGTADSARVRGFCAGSLLHGSGRRRKTEKGSEVTARSVGGRS